jgi:hypothetical protein
LVLFNFVTMKALLLSLLLFLSNVSLAQGWMPQGARAAAIGNAAVGLTDVFAFHHNPGALGFMTNASAAVSYENRFLLRELQSQSFAAATPLKTGVVSLGGQFYGYEHFRTTRIGGGYSMKLSDNFAAGVQMNYLNLRLDPFYGVKHAVTAEVGGLLKVDDNLSLGFSVFNLGRSRLSEYQDDRFSTIMRIGGFYKFSDHLAIAAEIGKDITHKVRVRTGLEYQPIDVLYFRLGMQTSPIEFSGGVGVKLNAFQLDIASHYHQLLGWTPGLNLIYNFGN